MKVLVLGATGRTGRLVVQQALDAGHTVRALVRSPAKLSISHPALVIARGQATDPVDVGRAMTGVDAVISTLGANGGSLITDATRAIIAGASTSRVQRIVLLSSFAVQRHRLSRPARVMSRLALSAAVRDKSTAEELLRASGLDWTIVHAVRLTDGTATGRVRTLPEHDVLHLGDSISRADVAAWLVTAASDTSTAHRAVAIAA